ncbi:MAG: capsular biosynthesis protein [Lachnospiraceae bacterium]|nr:capsular biosynthesis protein [Lachnospiraceae bacterium]
MDDQRLTNDEIEIDLQELLFALRIKWRPILLSALLAAAIAFGYRYYLVAPVYESNALLYVLTKSTSITSLADLQTGANLTQDYLIVTKDRPVLEKVIADLQLPEGYATLGKNVEVSNPTNTRFIKISVKDEDPKRAKAICDQIAKVAAAFIAEKMDQDPPNLVKGGYADGSPVNRSIRFYTGVGFLIGLGIAVMLVVLREIFNDDVSSPEDVENKIGLRVLASLPLEEAEDL